MANIPVCDYALLIGAGFSSDFGGYLAREINTGVWKRLRKGLQEWIVSKRREAISESLPFGFEQLLDATLSSTALSDEDKEAIQVGIEAVFREMDAVMCDRILHSHSVGKRIPSRVFSNFVSYFSGAQSQSRGFLFSLNQDLLVERAWVEGGSHPITIWMPGLASFPHQLKSTPFDDLQNLQLPGTVEESIDPSVNLCFVKLHGSINWRSSTDRGQCLVIGTEKSPQIEKEPLLRWYHQLFRSVLLRPGVKLAVAGYGFGDGHINEVIASAMEDFDLALHVVAPQDWDGFLDMMNRAAYGETLKHGTLCPHRVVDLYDDDFDRPNREGRKLLADLGIRNFAQEFGQ